MPNHTESQTTTPRSQEFLHRNPVFTPEEFAHHLGGPNALARARFRLKYFAREGRVKPIIRGVFATVPFETTVKRHEPDPFLVAAAARPDAVFCHHSALELHGRAHSVWNVVTVYTRRRRSTVTLGSSRVAFLVHPPAMKKGRRGGVGMEELLRRWTRTVTRAGRSLTFTSPERTLVEGFRSLRWVGGVDELIESASGFATLNLHDLTDVLSLYDSPRLWAAVGWFLETNQSRLFLPDAFLEDLGRHRPKSPVYLEPGRVGATYVPRWNLLVPRHLLREPGSGAYGA
jgi:predicted transcriptional regulator of viral defense system